MTLSLEMAVADDADAKAAKMVTTTMRKFVQGCITREIGREIRSGQMKKTFRGSGYLEDPLDFEEIRRTQDTPKRGLRAKFESDVAMSHGRRNSCRSGRLLDVYAHEIHRHAS